MELTLRQEEAETEVRVICDGQFSHTFDLNMLFSDDQMSQLEPSNDPRAYGQTVYRALFPEGSCAHRVLDSSAKATRILLVAPNETLDAIPWEFAFGPNDFLTKDYYFVRGLPAHERIDPPQPENDLHIIAVPSNPLGAIPLNIDGEWERLKDIIQSLPYKITLERARPPTLEQLSCLVANQHNRVIHFAGHGARPASGTVLYFERDDGSIDQVTAQDLIRRIRGTVFLVVLDACVSASPGPTHFSNIAAALSQQKIPYALGMRFRISDEAARKFSRVFYSHLAQGSLVEEAMLQARLKLSESEKDPWVIGVPILYTALHCACCRFRTSRR